MYRLNIDGRELLGHEGQTILDIALENGIQIPSFCYDKRMDIYGSCGICVVEVEGSPKLLRACATKIMDGMIIMTDTPRVRESRKLNLELLLSQHVGDCRAPCVLACPAQTDCQGYVGLIANGEMDEALKLIKTKLPLAASIGRVCPNPCQEACRRKLVEEPVSILNLKRFAADIDLDKPEPYLPDVAACTGKSVAIVGGGPGGLTCAYFLRQKGHSVTVFDAMPKMGGMLRYGIPEYRLPKSIVDKEAALIEKMGVVFKNNIKVGTDISFDKLKKDHDAVVIAIGAWESTPLPCPGADLPGVFGGIDFLRKVYSNEPFSVGKSVAVVGGGNTAMDACRIAVRLGAEKVYIIYRRTRAEMPADEIEIIESEEEGVIFKFLVNPLEVLEENGKAAKMRLQKMRLGEPDESGRRRPEPVEGEDEIIETDTIIAALGQGIIPDAFSGIELTRWNTVVADKQSFATNENGVFAIGDCVNDGASIAIEAIGDARKAAIAIDGFLSGIQIDRKEPYRVRREDLTEADFTNYKKEPRSHPRHLAPEKRKDNFFEVMETLDAEQAIKDATRCLECGCHDYFECKLIDLADKHDLDPERFRESVPNNEFEDDHPFILRDPNKCILCGLCVRMCDEVVGAGALGFVDRGYDTVVKPAFEDALKDTPCVSCGQCITVCPTGALQERLLFKKSIPFETVKVASVCGMCAVGCQTQIETAGNMLVKTTPASCGVNGGIMCGRGRFGINYVQKEGRIITPLIRKDGTLEPATWRDAFVYTAKKIESLKLRGAKTSVSIGHNYCIEDAGAIINLAALLGSEVFSFMGRENGLAKILGYDASPNTLEEAVSSNEVFVVGSKMARNPVIVSKLRQAVKKGTAVTVIASNDSEINLPCRVICATDSNAFIKQLIKAVIDSGCEPKNANGFEELKSSLSNISPGDDAKAVAKSYMAAKKAMIMFAIDELSTQAAADLANLAVVSGHIGSPRDGIYMLREGSGSQILADYGVSAAADSFKGTKGLMMFGEDASQCLDELEFLMVQDTHMTETVKKADVVFPLAAYPEIDGTYVNTERRLQCGCKAVEPPFELRTFEIAQGIADVIEASAAQGCPGRMYASTQIGKCGHAQMMCSEGFGFPDKKAKLCVTDAAPIFTEQMHTSYLVNAIDSDLP